MFSKFFVVIPFVLGLSLQASAHAIISPALGVTGTPVRNDVQRPSTAKPCGNVNIAQTIDTVTPVAAAADGSFSTNITNFNGGKDGSTQVTAQVDATGTGSSFVDADVTQNGVLAPTTVGSAQLTVQLPSGTQCTGGANQDLCLVSFVTAGGFGNCIAVSQNAAAAATNGTTAATGATATNGTTTAAGATAANGTDTGAATTATNGTTTGTTGTTTGKKHHHKNPAAVAAAAQQAKAKAKAQSAARAWGSRMARMARVFHEEEEMVM